jgi:hypothetical protein
MSGKKFEGVKPESDSSDLVESAASRQRAERRSQVLDLHIQGLTLRQIAARLGVGERTVKRDFAQVKPLIRARAEKLAEKKKREIFEQFAGLSGAQRSYALRAICGQMLEAKKKKEPGLRLILVADPDGETKGTDGLICVPPNLSYSFGKPLTIEVYMFTHGELKKMGELTFGQNTRR